MNKWLQFTLKEITETLLLSDVNPLTNCINYI